jgi:hypothetical protein
MAQHKFIELVVALVALQVKVAVDKQTQPDKLTLVAAEEKEIETVETVDLEL